MTVGSSEDEVMMVEFLPQFQMWPFRRSMATFTSTTKRSDNTLHSDNTIAFKVSTPWEVIVLAVSAQQINRLDTKTLATCYL